MNKKVYEYGIPQTGDFILHMPRGAKILSLQIERAPMLLVLADDTEENVPRAFHIVVTGEKLFSKDTPLTKFTPHPEYIGTFKMSDQGEIHHLFEMASDYIIGIDPAVGGVIIRKLI